MTAAQILGEVFYSIIGLVFILVGVKALKDEGCSKKATTAAFWFLLAFTFICGPWVPKWLVGAAIVVMACLTAIGGVVQSKNDVPDPATVRANADKFGYKIFIPAACIALVAVVGATLGSKVPALSWLTANNAIGLSGMVALCAVLLLTKAPAKYAAIDGSRLMDNVSTTGILPQLLSALGALFTAAGVGDAVGRDGSHLGAGVGGIAVAKAHNHTALNIVLTACVGGEIIDVGVLGIAVPVE